ncbi:protein of unknown function DUF395, YeeE/YedE [Sulfobacillus acidophilus TPY]|uniref:Uncharacterized protein n=1 Tax=Sulfobacillus acidophilus (strain ATCC 700253 / DSM 10332 / NAL) TaxID=679936 RepID=G8TVE3_SULAD|nr:protein of unknown function DUF395, YeeE/YedE [Sulfobacillus acidophilus TPY]AEW05862.1 protein of unknown function DUF395 YeeE/YedE [Sulfobacillus acidophilus DSM 10332]
MTILANLPAITPGWVLIGLFVLLGIGFGIILERSRFCFTTAFQETMEFRNPWILQAVFLWMGLSALVVSGLTEWGGVQPQLFNQGWYTVFGGFLFGTGMSMCGACASGQLFRAGSGYVANWMEFIGAGFGGILFALWFYPAVEQRALAHSQPLSLPATLHVPPIVWGLGSAVLFLGLAWRLHRRVPQRRSASYQEKTFRLSLRHPWNPLAGAILLTVLSTLYLVLSSGTSMSINTPNTLTIAWLVNWVTKPLGYNLATHGFFVEADYHHHIYSRLSPLALNQIYEPHFGHHLGDLALGVWLFIPLTIVGAFLSSRIAGEFKWRIPQKRSKLLWYLIGGVIMGFGAATALGCNIGAWTESFAARFDLSGLLFTVGMFPGVWFGTRLDEWVADRLWGFDQPTPVLRPRPREAMPAQAVEDR